MSKQIQAMINRHPDKFDSWHTEYDGYGESCNDHLPSYWVYCKEGWIIPDKECGSIHTKTVKEALALMKTVESGCFMDGFTSPHHWVTSSKYDCVVQTCSQCKKEQRIS